MHTDIEHPEHLSIMGNVVTVIAGPDLEPEKLLNQRRKRVEAVRQIKPVSDYRAFNPARLRRSPEPAGAIAPGPHEGSQTGGRTSSSGPSTLVNMLCGGTSAISSITEQVVTISVHHHSTRQPKPFGTSPSPSITPTGPILIV